MRLSDQQRKIMTQAVLCRDAGAEIFLFGSRIDDSAKGGDIDLLILSDQLGFGDVWPIRRDILDEIGWQKLDLLIEPKSGARSPFAQLVQENAVAL